MPASVPNCGIDNRLLGYEERLIMHARFVVWMISIAVMVLGVGAVHGQNYPNKPIRIVTSEIGGSSDFMARVIAQGISGPLGQPVITDNRGGGVIPGEIGFAIHSSIGNNIYTQDSLNYNNNTDS